MINPTSITVKLNGVSDSDKEDLKNNLDPYEGNDHVEVNYKTDRVRIKEICCLSIALEIMLYLEDNAWDWEERNY